MTPFIFSQYVFQGVVSAALGFLVVGIVVAVIRWFGEYGSALGRLIKRWSKPAFEEIRRYDARTDEMEVIIRDHKPVWMKRRRVGWGRS